jgi:hypothetical protein
MRRKLFVLGGLCALICGSLSPAAVSIKASSSYKPFVFEPASAQEGHTIKITPIGPTQESIDAAKARVFKHPTVKQLLKGAESRMISFQLIESAANGTADGFKATLFDYTNNRAYVCSGQIDGTDLSVESLVDQPDRGEGEFDAAVEILRRDPELGPALRSGGLSPYLSMPVLISGDAPVGKVNRTVTVGLMPKGIKYENQIVGVDLIAKKVVRFPNHAPPAAVASPAVCGLPNDTDPNHNTPSGSGHAGQADVVISRDGVEIWAFTVLRPSISSGLRHSAVELRNVNYRGKRILTRAHVPILNVQYNGNACGPYRDWQYDEGWFTANGTDVPGPIANGHFRVCTTPPQTILESGTDNGNFQGVAVYDSKEEVTVVSELTASWYRYISRWTFTDNGVIKPRFGFGATVNGCVCNIHTHHVYWRLDFDINTAAHNVVVDNLPGGPELVKSEQMRPRVDRLNQTWTISNTLTNESVILRPGPWDGNYDKYGRGDVWVLAGHAPNELDDGCSTLSCGGDTRANLALLVNGESTNDSDIVVWYGAHFNHIAGNVACGTSAGPDIEIRHW